MTDSNVFQLSQPGMLCDPLTEVLRSGARALLAQAVAAEVAGFLRGPRRQASPTMDVNGWCATVTCPSARL